jgi:formylglycine-generating enzyme required for sulfatase activity
VLNLSDAPTAVEQVSISDETIHVYPASANGKSIVSFFAKQAGSTQLSVFSIDGKKVAGISSDLQVGNNIFELSTPKGVFVIQVTGNEYAYTTKMLNQTGTQGNPGIAYVVTEKPATSGPQKSKSSTLGVTTMSYTVGDQLLYTANSGTYIASVPDAPTASKTINFVFSILPTSAIPAGTFIMGSPATEVGRSNNETQHAVTLSAFHISKYLITNAQYAAFLNAKNIDIIYAAGAYPTEALIYPSSPSSPSGNFCDWGLHYNDTLWVPVAGYENNPVIYVTWYGAAEFATYVGGTLPTEAQWEYACRAGTTTPFNTGTCLTNLQANYDWRYPYDTCTNTVTTSPGTTQPVGSYPANAYGLYDTHGNVGEWCADWFGTYPTTAQTNPTGASAGSCRVLRGGNFGTNAQNCRSSRRGFTLPSGSNGGFGFRVVFVP